MLLTCRLNSLVTPISVETFLSSLRCWIKPSCFCLNVDLNLYRMQHLSTETEALLSNSNKGFWLKAHRWWVIADIEYFNMNQIAQSYKIGCLVLSGAVFAWTYSNVVSTFLLVQIIASYQWKVSSIKHLKYMRNVYFSVM